LASSAPVAREVAAQSWLSDESAHYESVTLLDLSPKRSRLAVTRIDVLVLFSSAA
jgi:hypothetical protein